MVRLVYVRGLGVTKLSKITGKFTMKQALQRGIEAHKAGDLKQATQFYTAILDLDPKHPDASHNMGVLSVNLGKIEQALPLFKTALEANPATAQFWLSYIDTLLKLNKSAEAKTVFDYAKKNGAKGPGFDLLQQRLLEKNQVANETIERGKQPDVAQKNVLHDLNLEQLLKLAKKKEQKEFEDEAKNIYQYILTKFPKNKRAAAGLTLLRKSQTLKNRATQEPPAQQISSLQRLFDRKLYDEAFKYAEKLSERYPNSSSVSQMKGAIFHGLGEISRSIEAYEKAILIEPNSFAAYNNLSVVLSESGQMESAIKVALEALKIKPDSDVAHYNLGDIHFKKGNIGSAIVAYKRAIAINPKFFLAHHNLGNAYRTQKCFQEAITSYKTALDVSPSFEKSHFGLATVYKQTGQITKAMNELELSLKIRPFEAAYESYLALSNQLLGPPSKGPQSAFEKQLNVLISEKNPKHLIHHAIRAFLQASFTQSQRNLDNFLKIESQVFEQLPIQERNFCISYYKFISALIPKLRQVEHLPPEENTIYHIGESHCLSYAHQRIKFKSTAHHITPRLTLGAKAYHFSQLDNNSYKAITKINLEKIPNKSKVFVSFGEIDCRSNEGFIRAFDEHKLSNTSIISDVIQGYFEWFKLQNSHKQHTMYFFNIPAPIYNNTISKDLNIRTAKIVLDYNQCFTEIAAKYNFKIVDVYQLTVLPSGYSNQKFHIDNYHLGPNVINDIEKQLEDLV